jgi:hypothetical protein
MAGASLFGAAIAMSAAASHAARKSAPIASARDGWQELVQRSRRYSWALLLVACAGLSAGCGGGGDSATSQSAGGNPSGVGGATLTWDPPPPDPNLRGYRVYYGTGPGTYVQTLGSGVDVGNVTTHSISGLNSGTRYYFVATAYDATGNESGYSNEVSKDIP